MKIVPEMKSWLRPCI